MWAGTRWVPEYGRELTERKLAELRGTDPSATVFDVTWDRADFVDGRRRAERRRGRGGRATGSPLLIGDTDAFATTIWEERYLGSASAAVRDRVRRPDLYLLTDDEGVPFVDDGLRDGEHLRRWMTGRFRTELAARGVPHVVLTGSHGRRLRAAGAATDALLARGWSFSAPLSPPGPGPNGR